MGTIGIAAAREAAAKASSGRFLRLENDGDKVVVAFLGEPYSREVIWDEKKNQYVEAPPDAERGQLRVSYNVYDPAQQKVRIFEQGVVWFKQVLNMHDKYTEVTPEGEKLTGLDTQYYEMKREGAKGNTRTTYAIFPDKKISPEERIQLRKLKLHDLVKAATDDEEEATSDAKSSNGASEHIDPEVATQLVAKLKDMPQASLKEFLITFGVQKVRDVPKSRQAEAVALVERLKPQAPAAAPAEVDPFS